MIFIETKLKGAFIIEMEQKPEDYGVLAYQFDRDEFAKHGLKTNILETNIDYIEHANSVVGLHFHTAPYDETKLIYVTAGALYNVIVDLRSDSPTFKQWYGVELSARNGRMIYVPEGFAHGFQTLAAHTEVFYTMFQLHQEESQRGIRWDDPTLAIQWISTVSPIISAEDKDLPFLANIELPQK